MHLSQAQGRRVLNPSGDETLRTGTDREPARRDPGACGPSVCADASRANALHAAWVADRYNCRMYKIRTFNQIASRGLDRFSRDDYELGSEISDPDAILLRSHPLAVEETGSRLLCVGRAGAGVNNVPVQALSERGIVVFNTPGANANAVKELVMAAMLVTGRGVVPGIEFVRTASLSAADATELHTTVEAHKRQFKGHELMGRTLGVLGLGAIGARVAEAALQMGMHVLGYDPAISVDAAWRLPSDVERMENQQALFARSDIVTLHVPLLESTRGLINVDALGYFREGATLLNFAREEIVDTEALDDALRQGRIRQYVSDFPNARLLQHEGVFATPHLGASTVEAEENCAVMAADQIIDFLEHGNIRNSVNYPDIVLERTTGYRLALSNRNVPRILGQVLSILADRDINVIDMLNKSRDEVAYNLIDIESEPTAELCAEIEAIDGVVNVRPVHSA